MVKRGLMAQTELIRAQAAKAELSGQFEVGKESIGKLDAAVREAELQVGELSLELQQDALNELTQSLADLSVVEETIRGASDRVRQTEIRSPVDGIVNTMEVNTIGAFVQPGAVVAGIVPTSETLLVEARVSPKDVAFIQANQRALIKITAYDFSIFGGIGGRVANVSADSLSILNGRGLLSGEGGDGRSRTREQRQVLRNHPGHDLLRRDNDWSQDDSPLPAEALQQGPRRGTP